MTSEGCWSTVVCSPAERETLGLTGQSEWLLACRLAAGHLGNHATDASPRPRSDRRLWLEWNDFDDRAQSLIERNPCPVTSSYGVPCVFFHGHGGAHFYAPSNGHAPTVSAGRSLPEHGVPERGGPGLGGPGLRRIAPRDDRLPPPAHQLPAQQPPASPPPVSPPPASQASQDGLDATAYRGGRRSTDAEPVRDAPAYRGRRHSDSIDDLPPVDDPRLAATVGLEEDSQVSGRPFITQDAPVGPIAQPDERVPSVSDALNEVADALSKLAEALRGR